MEHSIRLARALGHTLVSCRCGWNGRFRTDVKAQAEWSNHLQAGGPAAQHDNHEGGWAAGCPACESEVAEFIAASEAFQRGYEDATPWPKVKIADSIRNRAYLAFSELRKVVAIDREVAWGEQNEKARATGRRRSACRHLP